MIVGEWVPSSFRRSSRQNALAAHGAAAPRTPLPMRVLSKRRQGIPQGHTLQRPFRAALTEMILLVQ
jgi:hypothetical protein